MYGLYIFTAVFGLVLLLIQLLLGAFDFDGGHHEVNVHHDVDKDFKGSSLNLMSLRGLAAGMAMFGLTGGFFRTQDFTPLQSFFVALAVGIMFHLITSYTISRMTTFESSGNLNKTDVIGRVGRVYMSIDPSDTFGKIQISSGGDIFELNAYSDEYIRVGESVKVLSVDGSGRAKVVKVV